MPRSRKKSEKSKSLEKARKRLLESNDEKQVRLQKKRLRYSTVRSLETEEQRKARMEADRLSHSTSRSLETDEQREVRLRKDRLRHSETRNIESEEQKEERLRKDRFSHSEAIRVETEEQKIERLRKKRLSVSEARREESEEQKEERLRKDRFSHSEAIRVETEEQKIERLRKKRLSVSEARREESEQQKEERLRKDRYSHSEARYSLENSTIPQNASTFQYTPFEMYQKNLQWRDCNVCLEEFIGLKTVQGVCHRCVKVRDQFNKFSVENDMNPGIVPKELANLSMIEEQLIARVHPVISVYKLRGGQLGYSGQVINFPQDIQEVAKTLPKRIGDLTNIIVFRKNIGSTHADFNVNRNKVYEALLWLKNHNVYYKEIEIDSENLNTIPENGNVLDILSTQAEENVNFEDGNDIIISNTDVPDLVPRNNEAIIHKTFTSTDPVPWPPLIPVPINEFSHIGYIAMAFPTLFPTGECDLRAARQQKISPFEYFRHLMLYKDQRFSKHPRFRFFAMNSLMRWEALKKGNICMQKNSELRKHTVQELKSLIKSNPGIARNLVAFNSSLRGSSSYWFARSRELLDMVKFLGPPTLFLTLSAADLYWPEAFRLIQLPVTSENATENEKLRMRAILLNENPLVFSYIFKERVEFFINRVICPKFKVKDYWYRTEFQHRGSPHIHGIFWLEGAPDVRNLDEKTEEERDNIAEYFGNIISTINPNFNAPKPTIHPCSVHYSEVADHDNDYINLLNACQRHTKHGPQCLRKLKKSGEEICRFKFPFDLEEKTHLCKEESKWILKTERNDRLMNSHNRFITEHWRANTDIQPILSIDAVLNYIAKYASKSEPKSRGLESLIENTLSKVSPENLTVKSLIQKLFIKMCNERDYSAQESFYILMGWPLYHSSREFIRLNVEEDKWIPIEEDQEIGNIERSQSLYDAYPLRSEDLENLSMYDFFSKYYKTRNNLVKRRKPAVVRISPRLLPNSDRNTENEKFYRQQLITRIPWRQISEFHCHGSTWQAIHEKFFQGSNSDALFSMENADVADEEFETEEEEDEKQDKEDWMMLAGLGANEEEIKIGMRPQDINFQWDASYSNYESPLSLPSYISFQKSMINPGEHNIKTTMPNVILSEEQKLVLNILKDQLNFLTDKSIAPPRSVIVQGRAGSGKSTLIQAMTHIINEELGRKSYLLLAPTGAAALNIFGSTIHSALHIGSERQHRPLSNELLHSFQCSMKECKFLIIDEMSMLGCSLLKKIDLRCREAKPNFAHEPFGGLFLYLLGDIKQLPPVMDRPLYGQSFKGAMYDQGQLLFQSIERSVVLQSCHRQKGESQERFRDVLDKISVGQASLEDWKYLMRRNIMSLSVEEVREFNDCIHLFATNSEAQSYNLQKLKNLSSPVALISALHNNKDAKKYDQDILQGLESTLYLCVGARVMLRTNIWTSKGLVNGALGIVKDILYKPGNKPPNDFPITVLVEFDNYSGPSVNGLVPISPVSRSWTADGKIFTRTQFPLSLAWAVTIHKSQGLTLPKTLINIGEKELMLGITYVALSRVRRITDLVFDPGFSYDRLECIKKCKLLNSRIKEENRLLNLI